MSLNRFALLRPIQIEDGSDAFSISATSGGVAVIYGIDVGTYGHIGSLLADFVDKADATVADLTVSIVTGGPSESNHGKIRFSSASNNFRIDWDDTPLRDILGFTGSSTTSTGSGPYTATATYRPQYCWFSQNGTSDLNAWISNDDMVFAGGIAQNGQTSGLQTGDILHRLSLEIIHEPARYVLEALDETAVDQGVTADSIRSLEYLVRQSKVVTPVSGVSVNPKGAYLWYDSSTITASSDCTTREGIYSLASTPDLFKFVSIESMTPPTASVGRSRQYWSGSINLVTASAPTWSAPA